MNKWEKALGDFAGCSDRLEEAVSGLTAEQLDRAPEKGGWSVRQIIHHLADGAGIWGLFIHQALEGKGGEFNLHWYWDTTQEEWALIWGYASRDIGPSLEIYRANQRRLLSMLQGIEDPAALQLEIRIQGRDPESVSIQDAVRIQVLHLKEHLAEIKKLLAGESAHE